MKCNYLFYFCSYLGYFRVTHLFSLQYKVNILRYSSYYSYWFSRLYYGFLSNLQFNWVYTPAVYTIFYAKIIVFYCLHIWLNILANFTILCIFPGFCTYYMRFSYLLYSLFFTIPYGLRYRLYGVLNIFTIFYGFRYSSLTLSLFSLSECNNSTCLLNATKCGILTPGLRTIE